MKEFNLGDICLFGPVADSALVTLLYAVFLFSLGTMVTDPGTELHAMPGCLHLHLDALSQGKNWVVSFKERRIRELL